MNEQKKIKIFLGLLLLSVVVWIAESVIHYISIPKDRFVDSLMLNISAHELYMRLMAVMASCMIFLLFINNKVIREKEAQIENILNNVIPICITNINYQIIMANESYWKIWGRPDKNNIRCFEHRPGDDCHTANCALRQILNGASEFVRESKKKYDNQTHHFIVMSRPFFSAKKEIVGIVESFQDITCRRNLEDEKSQLINQLQASLEKVKLLSGFLPICASCKKIRDDKGYWNQIESYIQNHSEAEFSHGLCPKCAHELYPELYPPDPE